MLFLTSGAEHANKFVRYYRAHHARQTNLAENLKDFFLRCIHSSDPEILYLISGSSTPDWSKPGVLPTAVKGLLLYPEKFIFSDLAADLVVELDFDLEMATEEVVVAMEEEDDEIIVLN